LELGRRDDGDALQVPEALLEHGLVAGDEEDEGPILAPRIDEGSRRLGRGLRPGRTVDEGQRPFLRVRSQCGAKRRASPPPVHLDLERARLWREGDAAAGPVGSTRAAGACAAGALLPPGLRAPAGDEAAALRAASPGPLRVQLGAHRLVDEM